MLDSRKKIIGLLGGIASGKSTASAELKRLGCAVIDADKIAKSLLLNNVIKQQLCSIFGQGILNPAGDINRAILAEKAFANADAVEKINSVIHPPVLAEIKKQMADYAEKSVKAIVLDVPLLLETGWEKNCDTLIFIECTVENRLKRAKKRGVVAREQLKKRENFQISLDKKRKIANYIIENNDLSDFLCQIGKLFPVLIAE